MTLACPALDLKSFGATSFESGRETAKMLGNEAAPQSSSPEGCFYVPLHANTKTMFKVLRCQDQLLSASQY